MKKFVIEEKDLRRFVEAELKLNRLEAFGVDNWEGYEEALEDFNEDIDYHISYYKEAVLKDLDSVAVDALNEVNEHIEKNGKPGTGYAYIKDEYLREEFSNNEIDEICEKAIELINASLVEKGFGDDFEAIHEDEWLCVYEI